jgi:hypothetical protein
MRGQSGPVGLAPRNIGFQPRSLLGGKKAFKFSKPFINSQPICIQSKI